MLLSVSRMIQEECCLPTPPCSQSVASDTQRVSTTGPARGWSGGRGGGRSPHAGPGAFNSMQANATAGQMAGMQLNSPGQPTQRQAHKFVPTCYAPSV